MPVPEILDLDPASDVRFRDVYGRHYNRIMSRGGNLILTMYHHVSGAQANVSAAEIVSLDTTENAQYDLLLSSGTPLSGANLTNANIATWSAGSLLSIRQGTTSIRSANISVGNLILQENATAQLNNFIVRSFQKSLGQTVGNATEICTITQLNSAYAVELNLVESSSAYITYPKVYKFTVTNANASPSTWKRVLPLSSTNTVRWGLEILVDNNVTTLRLVRTTALVAATTFGCTLTVSQSRANPVTITESTSTTTGVTLSTTLFESTALTQVSGNVGIGTDSPTSTLDVPGMFRAYKHLANDKFVGTPLLLEGAYIAWNTRTASTGETDFVNKSGSGAGGFYFFNSTNSGTPTEFNLNTQMASITSAGITLPSGSFNAPGSIVGTVFATGWDSSINEGVTLSTTSFNKTTWGTTWATVATFTYTPKSDASSLWIHFDDDYVIDGGGPDTIQSRITVDNVEIIAKQQKYNSSNAGSGTRSGVIFPISGIFANTSTAQKTIRIQVYMNNVDDTLIVAATGWMFELLERKT